MLRSLSVYVLCFAIALTVAAVLVLPVLDGGPVKATHATIPEVAVDMDVRGNGDNSLGPTEFCGRARSIGERFDVDIVVRGVPAPDLYQGIHGIAGYSIDVLFNPRMVRLVKLHLFDGSTILQADGLGLPFVVTTRPGVRQQPNGSFGVDAADLGGDVESGDGVLTRVTFEIINEGISQIEVGDFNPEHYLGSQPGSVPDILDYTGRVYLLDRVVQGIVAAGPDQVCPDSPPLAIPATPLPYPTEGPPPVPQAGDFNCNGIFEESEGHELLLFVAGWLDHLDGDCIELADMNCDGQVTLGDLFLVFHNYGPAACQPVPTPLPGDRLGKRLILSLPEVTADFGGYGALVPIQFSGDLTVGAYHLEVLFNPTNIDVVCSYGPAASCVPLAPGKLAIIGVVPGGADPSGFHQLYVQAREPGDYYLQLRVVTMLDASGVDITTSTRAVHGIAHIVDPYPTPTPDPDQTDTPTPILTPSPGPTRTSVGTVQPVRR